MSRQTPGPWEFIDATKSAKYKFSPTCVIKAGPKQVASFSWHDNSPWFPTKDESQANARLIAAAPDLLEALKSMVAMAADYNLSHTAEACFSRFALSKAEGHQ